MAWTMIAIHFLPRWKEPMLYGSKTHTCRSKAYGKPGDRFRRFGATFELVRVWQTTLHDVAMNYYLVEGCRSPNEFVGVWNEIHPTRRFIGSDVRWLHEFRRVKGD